MLTAHYWVKLLSVHYMGSREWVTERVISDTAHMSSKNVIIIKGILFFQEIEKGASSELQINSCGFPDCIV